MKIVVLDGFTLNPGDLSWEDLQRLGDCDIHDRTPTDLVLSRCENAEAVFTNKVILSRQLMQQLPDLKYIGVLATGYNVVDIQAASELGIVVTNTPGYGSVSVAQFVFAQLLSFAQPVSYYDASVKTGRWSESVDFCYYDHSMTELAGKVMGIVGFGHIGRKVAQIARCFDMRVVTTSPRKPKDLPSDIDYLPLDELLRCSDVVTLHCPLTDDNKGMVNRDFLDKMKPTDYLINSARGSLVDEAALLEALQQKSIAGAALDVLAQEPPSRDNPLLLLENCLITPHIAWATTAARQRLMDIAVENLRAYVSGNLLNVVSV
ncbi:MAG: D-2-hydroxyacid dehydrogenase [Pseudomonadota bacterium]